MPVAGNDEFLRNMFAEFMRIQATNTTPKSKSERTVDPEIFSGDGGNTEITCCGPYRTVLSEYRIRARGGRRVGSRRRGVSRSAKGFGGTWWW